MALLFLTDFLRLLLMLQKLHLVSRNPKQISFLNFLHFLFPCDRLTTVMLTECYLLLALANGEQM